MEKPNRNLVAAESESVPANDSSAGQAPETARALADWELALVGGGDTTPCW